MRGKWFGLICMFGLLATGCGDDSSTGEQCSGPADCLQGAVSGQCLQSPSSTAKWCAFPDPQCSGSSQRWGLLAGDGLKSTCVSPADGGVDGALQDGALVDGSQLPADSSVDGSTAVTVTVPQGLVMLGCCGNDPECAGVADENPCHSVNINTFKIDRTEVTQAAYSACVTAGQCTAPSANFAPGTMATHPVTNVTIVQAGQFCTFVGGRLPTEAEWEKAARGTATRRFPWGPATQSCLLANYGGCRGGTAPVGSYPAGAGPFGTEDMAGNVSEWVSDFYGSTYYSDLRDIELITSPATDPPGPATGTDRITRGGDWMDTGSVRTSRRVTVVPSTSSPRIGFRCVRP